MISFQKSVGSIVTCNVRFLDANNLMPKISRPPPLQRPETVTVGEMVLDMHTGMHTLAHPPSSWCTGTGKAQPVRCIGIQENYYSRRMYAYRSGYYYTRSCGLADGGGCSPCSLAEGGGWQVIVPVPRIQPALSSLALHSSRSGGSGPQAGPVALRAS